MEEFEERPVGPGKTQFVFSDHLSLEVVVAFDLVGFFWKWDNEIIRELEPIGDA